MDNLYPRVPKAIWSLFYRQSVGARSRRVTFVASILLVCLLVPRDLVANSIELADNGKPPLAIDVPPGSVEEYTPNEIVYHLPDAESDPLSGAPDAYDTYEDDSNQYNSKATKAYDQYAGLPSRPDRWDHTGSQFPWLEFPGCSDDWRVGPVLGVRIDGLFLERTNVADNFLTNTLGAMPPYVLQHVKRFEHAAGARAYVTSRNLGYYAMQLGYVGAADWNASAESRFTDLADPLLNETRLNSYDSSLHAVELNFLPSSSSRLQWILGARYVDFSEDFTQLTDRVNFDINNNNLATGLNDDWNAVKIDNRLIGAHLGLRHDIWSQHRRFSLEALINGGPFGNLIARKEIDQTYVTVNRVDDPATVEDESHQTELRMDETVRRRRTAELAFFGETTLTGVYRFHPCLSVRAGYQAVWLAGAHLASDPFGETSSLVFHGLHCGIEYRR